MSSASAHSLKLHCVVLLSFQVERVVDRYLAKNHCVQAREGKAAKRRVPRKHSHFISETQRIAKVSERSRVDKVTGRSAVLSPVSPIEYSYRPKTTALATAN